MKLNKKIEDLFEEKFQDYEVQPPSSSWDYIESKLQEKKKKRIVPFWYKASGIAASLILGGILWNQYSSNDSSNQNDHPVVNQNTNNINSKSIDQNKDQLTPTKQNTEIANTGNSSIKKDNNSQINSVDVRQKSNGFDQKQNVAIDQNNRSLKKSEFVATEKSVAESNNKIYSNDNLVNNKQKDINLNQLPNKVNQNGQIVDRFSQKESNEVEKSTNQLFNESKNKVVDKIDIERNNTITKKDFEKENAITNNVVKSQDINTNISNNITEKSNDQTKFNTIIKDNNVVTDNIVKKQDAKSIQSNNSVFEKSNDQTKFNTIIKDNNVVTDNNVKKQDAKSLQSSNNVSEKLDNDKVVKNNNSITDNVSKNQDDNSSQTKNLIEQLNSNKQLDNIVRNNNTVTDNGMRNQDNDSQKSNSVSENKVIAENSNKNVIEKKDLLKEIEKKDPTKEIKSKEENAKKWAVNAFASPVFYNTFINEAIISDEFEINEKGSQNAISFGVGLAYNLSSRLSIKAGINSINLDYKIDNVSYANSIDAQADDNISLRRNKNSKNLILMGKSSVVLARQSETQLIDNMTNRAAITQNVNYLEIPLELSYALINKKFSVQLKGGLSTLLLTRNDVFLRNNNDDLMNIGEASNLNSTHFTGNLGIGINYEFIKNVSFNIDPIARYQINPFTKTSNSNPFLLGVNTGLTYKF